MFDLEKEVAAWARSVHADRCRGAASVDELIDHLHCEIDHARAKGLSDEQAFAAAVARLGRAGELAAEHGKNRSWLAWVCANERGFASNRGRSLLLSHAIIWASLMLGTALVMSKRDDPDTFTLLLILVMLPLWGASDQILRRALRSQGRGER